MEIIIADIVKKKKQQQQYYGRRGGVLYHNKDVTVALNIPHDLTTIGCIDYRHYYIHNKPPKWIRVSCRTIIKTILFRNNVK